MAWAGRDRPYKLREWCGASAPSELPPHWNPAPLRMTHSEPPPMRSRRDARDTATRPEVLTDAGDPRSQEFLALLERLAALYGDVQAESRRLHSELGNGHCCALGDAPAGGADGLCDMAEAPPSSWDPEKAKGNCSKIHGSSSCSTLLPPESPSPDAKNIARARPKLRLPSPYLAVKDVPRSKSSFDVVSPTRSISGLGFRLSTPETSQICQNRREREVRRQYKRLRQKAAKKNHSVMEELDVLMVNPGPYCADIVQAVNSCLGRTDGAETLDMETFQCLMLSEDLEETLPPELYERVYEIRRVLREDDVNKIVSKHAYVSKTTLFDSDKGAPKRALLLQVLDPVSFFVIVVNSLLLAVSADYQPDWPGWQWVEYSFTCFFIFELFCKTSSRGVVAHFSGDAWRWNVADFVFVLFALTDVVLQLVTTSNSDLQLFTIMRLVRLCRVTRLVRLLRFKLFKELLLMIQGIVAGFRTLIWAIFLLLFVIFCLGMVMRQTLGKWCLLQTDLCGNDHLKEYGTQLFSTVTRSCFTVFRCFTEGCASVDGTPLLVHVYDNGLSGQFMVFLYMLCFLAVTFGLFNLIMAVFVENTIESAKQDERKRHQARQKDYNRIAKKLQRVVLQFVSGNSFARTSWLERSQVQEQVTFFQWFSRDPPRDEEPAIPEISMETEVTREMFGKVIEDPLMASLLEDMEVCIEDPMSLFDTLDADESGALDVAELSNGIMKLRGEATKSDAVASLLSVRATHRTLRNLDKRLEQDGEAQRAQNRELVRRLQALEQRLAPHSRRLAQPSSSEEDLPPLPSTPRRERAASDDAPEHVAPD